MNSINKKTNFKDFIELALSEFKIKEFTEVQEIVLNKFLSKKSLIISSPTGSGKTLSFLLPILNDLNLSNNFIQVVIFSPTRELANQIFKDILVFQKYEQRIKPVLLASGYIKKNIDNKLLNSNVVITTPDTFNSFYVKNKLNLNYLRYVVYDEADMLFDTGFFNTLQKFPFLFSKEIWCAVVSASLHESMLFNLKKLFYNAAVVNCSKKMWIHKNIKHHLIGPDTVENLDKLYAFVNTIQPYLCLIFFNTKESATNIFNRCDFFNRNAILFHGGLEPRKRKQLLKQIKDNKYQFVFTTDIASRGINWGNVSHVISYEMPNDDLWYLHRTGRTGRINSLGDSYVFLSSEYVKQIKRLEAKGIDWYYLKVQNKHLI